MSFVLYGSIAVGDFLHLKKYEFKATGLAIAHVMDEVDIELPQRIREETCHISG